MGSGERALRRTPVLFVNTPTLAPIGADTWIHTEIIRTLDRSRFEVHVACATGTAQEPTPMYRAVADVDDVTLVPVDFGHEHVAETPLRRLVEKFGDLRIVPSMAKLAWHVRRHRIPIIHTVSRPRDALACVLLARMTRTKCIIHMQLALGAWMSRPLRWSLRNADALVAISEFVAGTLTAGGVPPERIHLAYNAVVLERWTPPDDRARVRTELDLPEAAPIIVTVSRLFPGKGTAELLHAVALVRKRLPDVVLVVVGSDTTGGSFMRQLEDIVAQEDLHDNVRFVGQRSDIARFMAAADIFAMPSFEEPFGIVFAEAMAMERPVVALNNGGTPEVVDDGRAGLLSAPGDIEGLAENVLTLLGDPALCERMGAYGRQRVEERFTVERLSSAMAGIYESVAR